MTHKLTEIDERYQHALQKRINALVNRTRQAQWQEISHSDEGVEIGLEDKVLNRRIAVMTGVAATGALAKLFPPFLAITIPLALYDLMGYTIYVYKDIKERRTLKLEHLLVIFLGALWGYGYFVIGGLSFSLYYLILKMSLQSQDHTRKELINIMGEQPRQVWVLVDGAEIQIPFTQLQVGDVLSIQAGQMIPVDGIITQGAAAIDQHRLTGESQPAEKGVGDPVLAATVVLRGRLRIQVEKTGESTLAAQIGEVLANTLDYHLTLEEQAEKLANWWTMPSLALAGLAAVVRSLQSAISVFFSIPGFDMLVLGPMTLINFLNLASRNHVLIKDGRSLELLRKVNTIIFDKTGTLTLEQPQVKTIHICHDLDSPLTTDIVLTYAAAAEQRQGHPIAKALLDAAQAQALSLPTINDADYELGYGLRVWLEQDDKMMDDHTVSQSRLIRVGSERFMQMESVEIPSEIIDIQNGCHELGNSLVMVAVEDRLVGAIELQPTIRPEAHAVIEALHERKIETAIISGDQEAPTRTLARELGIERYFANVLPEEKGEFVAKLQAEGKTVCFVGDGINDAIALKKAEVSISLRGATTIATDTAQIVLMDQTLEKLPILIDLSNELHRNLTTSLILVTVPCCFVIGGVFFLGAGIPLAVTTYTTTLALGVANAMSPMFRRLEG
ncbi:MAG: heavy metal translocating P-type ATPase [Chloroflexota bacterium]